MRQEFLLFVNYTATGLQAALIFTHRSAQHTYLCTTCSFSSQTFSTRTPFSLAPWFQVAYGQGGERKTVSLCTHRHHTPSALNLRISDTWEGRGALHCALLEDRLRLLFAVSSFLCYLSGHGSDDYKSDIPKTSQEVEIDLPQQLKDKGYLYKMIPSSRFRFCPDTEHRHGKIALLRLPEGLEI